MKQDLTDKVERDESMEEHLGIALSNFSAYLDSDDPEYISVTTQGEIRTRDGDHLPHDVDLTLAIYDQAGRVIQTGSHGFYVDDFFKMDTFSFHEYLPTDSVSKIRIYPKKI